MKPPGERICRNAPPEMAHRSHLWGGTYMRHIGRTHYLWPSIFLIACVAAQAQANSELNGIVTDASGAAVPSARIVLTDPATAATRTTISGEAGLYSFPGLDPATYNLRVIAQGFEAYLQNGIVVSTSATTRADVKLAVGAET